MWRSRSVLVLLNRNNNNSTRNSTRTGRRQMVEERSEQEMKTPLNHTDPVRSRVGVIATAPVPLASDFHPQPEERNASPSGPRLSRRWYLHIWLLGIVAGMLVAGISYGSLEMLQVQRQQDHRGDNQQQSGGGGAGTNLGFIILQHPILVLLLSRLRFLFSALFYIGCIWCFTPSGKACTKRWLLDTRNSTENSSSLVKNEDKDCGGGEETSGTSAWCCSDGTTWAVVVSVAFLECGFHNGLRFTDLFVNTIKEGRTPVSFLGLGTVLALDVLMCCWVLMLREYMMMGLESSDPREGNDEPYATIHV